MDLFRPAETITIAGLTVCVRGGGAGVDNAWEQEKLEASKMLESGAEFPAPSARFIEQPLV